MIVEFAQLITPSKDLFITYPCTISCQINVQTLTVIPFFIVVMLCNSHQKLILKGNYIICNSVSLLFVFLSPQFINLFDIIRTQLVLVNSFSHKYCFSAAFTSRLIPEQDITMNEWPQKEVVKNSMRFQLCLNSGHCLGCCVISRLKLNPFFLFFFFNMK